MLSDWGIRLRLTVLLGASCVGAALIAPGSASAVVFTNQSPITINDFAAASPSPSTIQVSGLPKSITDVDATLSGFTHTWPADVDVLLQSPGGGGVVLMSDAPNTSPLCGNDANGLNLTFDDSAPGPIPSAATLVSGSFIPTDYGLAASCGTADDSFPPPSGGAMATFNGTDPNGTWNLFVRDDSGTSIGSISGWQLDIDFAAPSNDFSLGKLKKNKNKGTAVLTVDVPGPGKLELSGTGIKPQRSSGGATASKTVDAAGPVTLPIKAKGKKKTKLKNRGKVKVTANVVFTPNFGTASTETKTVKLVKN